MNVPQGFIEVTCLNDGKRCIVRTDLIGAVYEYGPTKKDYGVMPAHTEIKRGDVIVSGVGNIRIFTGEKFDGDFYKCLACYCVSGCPAGTDMRYARHATEREKKIFFDTLKANGLEYDAKACTIKAGKNYKGV